jgi:PAS domain S-box-containing protein
LRPKRELHPPGLWLAAGYALVLGLLGLVALAALGHVTPAFFVQGRGGTSLRQLVLISAIAMFVVTAVLLAATSRRPMSAFAYWYALALGLIATGLFGVALPSSGAGIFGWTGRSVCYLGGLYMLVAAAACVRESRVWGLSLEAALRESEGRYHALFETAPDAIVVHRNGCFLDANATALRLTGADSLAQLACYSVLDFLGPGPREPTVERRTGRGLPVREARLRRLDGRDLAVEFRTAPVDFQGAAAAQTIIRDITERKRAEETLRELNATLERKVVQRTAELEHRTRQLQRLTLELTQAQERERKHVAEILHENLQQQIAGAKFQLNLLNSQPRDDVSRHMTAARINQILNDAIGMSRSLSHELSPALFYGNDLGEALDWLAGEAEDRHGLTVRVHVSGAATLQSETLTVFLFRAAREMLSNVARHAGVHEAAVRLRRTGRYVGLCVSDRGCGFDLPDLQETVGFGLLSIRERVELLGGRTKIESVKGHGTRVRIVVPDARENEGTPS